MIGPEENHDMAASTMIDRWKETITIIRLCRCPPNGLLSCCREYQSIFKLKLERFWKRFNTKKTFLKRDEDDNKKMFLFSVNDGISMDFSNPFDYHKECIFTFWSLSI
ncbi:hypothetical protein TNCV_4610801 [Trichonephila clavipes]|nr:hypothetical protein TNCV_4610801 [Trichonephila clavipes]